MNPIRSRRARGAVIALAAGSLVLTGCSDGGSTGKDKSSTQKDAKAQSLAVKLGDATASAGPAEDVKGAKEGGTIRVYQEDDFSHLDPGEIYVSDAGQLSALLHRGLTSFKEDGKGNKTVVGDLATDSGKKSDNGKTWTYTLKNGVKDQEGDAITSEDVRHSVERLYSPVITDGPLYVQQWLSGGGSSYRKALPDGPYKGDHLPDSVLETPDDETIVFHFKEAQPDLPQALTMPGYAVVPKDNDTKEKYDQGKGLVSARSVQDRRVQPRQGHEAGAQHRVGRQDGPHAPPVRGRLPHDVQPHPRGPDRADPLRPR